MAMKDNMSYQLDNYIFNEFCTKFSCFSNDPIAIYGIGERTGRLLEQIDSPFNIIGLLDGKFEEGEVWGKPILTLNQVVTAGCKVIIIVARAAVLSTIYHRIEQFVLKHEIKVYDIHGEDLSVKFKDRSYDIPYYHLCYDDLLDACEKHDIITFDIFDTLLTRKTLYPSDIFLFVEKRMKAEGDGVRYINNFAHVRMKAEDQCYKKGINPTIEEIYEELCRMTGIDDETAQIYLEKELEEELHFIAPRRKMIELFNELKVRKKVFLISDMYLRRDFIEKLLLKVGCTGYQDVFVSCEYGCSKRNGLFNIFKEKLKLLECECNILHIGDHEVIDGFCAKEAGIDSFCIMSGRDLLENSGYHEVLGKCSSLYDHLMVGLLCNTAFGDPFVFYKKSGKLEIRDYRMLSYLFCAPTFVTFAIWLMQNIENAGCEFVLYTARDAYVLKKIIEVINRKQNWIGFPDGIYTYVSRRALNSATIEDRLDIDRIIKHEYYGDLSSCIKDRFGVEVDKSLNSESGRFALQQKNGMLDVERRWDEVSAVIDEFEDDIMKEARREQENYIRYLTNILKQGYKRLACIDFVAAGTIQNGLEKLIPDNQIVGFYFLKKKTDEKKLEEMEAFSFYESLGEFQMDSNIYSFYLFLEMILTSPEPMVHSIDENGRPIFMQEFRTKNQIEIVMEMQNEIIKYANEIAELYPDLKHIEVNHDISDILLGMMGKEYSEITGKRILNMVLQDEYIAREFNIFDRV